MKKVCILLIGLISTLGATAQDVHEEQASISGRVLDVSSSPYPADVQVLQIVIREGFASLYSRCATNVGTDGRFECLKLPRGKFIVQILPLPQLVKQKVHDAATGTIPESIFYPGVTDLEQATPVSLRNNEAGWVEVRVVESSAVKVTGALPAHARIASFSLKAESGGLTLNTAMNPSYDQNTGKFVLPNVPPGHYQLTANLVDAITPAPLFPSASPSVAISAQFFPSTLRKTTSLEERHAMLPLVVGATPIDNLVLSAIPNVEIKGQIPTLPSGIAISQLLLLSADGSIHDSNTSVKDGAFDFRSVPPGEYILSLPLGQQVYVDSVSVGGKSSGSSRFTIAPGQDTVNLELEVKKSRAQIRGSVKEWQSAAASAEVIAQSEDSGEIYKVTTDKQKNFSFAGVKPGEYRLFAWPGVDTIEYRNPLVLKKYNNDSTEVRVDQDDIGSVIELSPIEKER
jgi:hypothetical protein